MAWICARTARREGLTRIYPMAVERMATNATVELLYGEKLSEQHWAVT